jgi:hypothetical protein
VEKGLRQAAEHSSDSGRETMTIEEADEVIKSLKSMLIAARTERDRLKSENSKQALRLAGAIMLLQAAKDALPSDDMVYLRIREFLDNEVGAE